MSRRQDQRRAAVFALYQHDLTGRPLDELFERDAAPFTRALAHATADNAEQLAVPESGVAEALRWTKANDAVDVLFIDGSPSDLQLPASVVLEVTQTEPGLRGDTASGGGTKPATLETGATITVPLFVNVGDSVKVDTRSGDYMSRA